MYHTFEAVSQHKANLNRVLRMVNLIKKEYRSSNKDHGAIALYYCYKTLHI